MLTILLYLSRELPLFFQEKGKLETWVSRGRDFDHGMSTELLGKINDEELFGFSCTSDIWQY